MEEPYSRIERMEAALNRADAAVSGLERALEEYRDALGDIALLEQYLNSEERRADLTADEEGALPPDLRRGVLSEDGVWNLLVRRDELMEELRELAEPAAIINE